MSGIAKDKKFYYFIHPIDCFTLVNFLLITFFLGKAKLKKRPIRAALMMISTYTRLEFWGVYILDFSALLLSVVCSLPDIALPAAMHPEPLDVHVLIDGVLEPVWLC